MLLFIEWHISIIQCQLFSTNKMRFMFIGDIKKLRLRIWFVQSWNAVAKKESEMEPMLGIFLTK